MPVSSGIVNFCFYFSTQTTRSIEILAEFGAILFVFLYFVLRVFRPRRPSLPLPVRLTWSLLAFQLLMF